MASSSGTSVHGGGAGDTPAQQTALSIVSVGAETVSVSRVFKIQGYSRTKGRLGVGVSIRSATFTVGGHGWQINYYPDGLSSGFAGWISMALVLVDTAATTSATARVTFSLLHEHSGIYKHAIHRSEGYCSTTRAILIKDLSLAGETFIESKRLEESAYLKDDCFMVRCNVTVTNKVHAQPVVVVPPSDMQQDLGRLLSSGEAADVAFEVGGERFAAHRCVLAARSSVFMAELFGPMKENNVACVRIDEMEARVFKAMLQFIYTESLPATDDGDAIEMAQHLLVAADRYNLERLKLICEEKLCRCTDTSTAATTLALAEQHGCRGLRVACFKFLASLGNLKAVMVSDGYEHLRSSCPNILEQLVANLAPRLL